jgi:hypothetical protein
LVFKKLPLLMALAKRLRVVMLSVPGGDVQALLNLRLSSAEGKVKKNFTSFYRIFHPLTPFDTGRP